MKRIKNLKWIIGVALIVTGCALIAAYFLKTPSHEITRVELEPVGLSNMRSPTAARSPVLTPGFTGWKAIQINGKAENFYLTTHLDDGEVNALFAGNG